MTKPLVIIALIVGVLLVIAAAVYFMTPARYLPSFFPGYDRALMTHHYKHGIGAILLGFACFVFAWFQSGKKKTESVKKEENS